MGSAITWYDVLGILPGASTGQVRDAYLAKSRQLAPDRISGAPSKVVAAAGRGLRVLDDAWRVLGDPTERSRYDREIAGPATGLATPRAVPSEPGWDPFAVDLPLGGGRLAAAAGLPAAVLERLTPRPGPSGRVVVPDVRGLFVSVCFDVVPRAGLKLATVRLTEHPMPADGLVVDQAPKPEERALRASTLTVRVWHPPVPRTPGRR